MQLVGVGVGGCWEGAERMEEDSGKEGKVVKGKEEEGRKKGRRRTGRETTMERETTGGRDWERGG